MLTTEQQMLGYTLVALKMIEIGDHGSCVDQVEKLLNLGVNAPIPSNLAKLIRKHLERLIVIKQDRNISDKQRMARFKVPLINMEIIFDRYGIK